MGSLGIGVYILAVVWSLTFMLCWVTVRTGHFIGKIAIIVSVVISLLLLALPKIEIQFTYSANLYEKFFVVRYTTIFVLLLSVIAGSVYTFFHTCLQPIDIRKIRSFGS